MGQNTKLLDLPSDILLQIFGECGVLDILNLSSTCKQSQQIADEHQVWSRQARRLQIPVPPEATPSKAELKDWVISRTRVHVCWIKHRPGDLALHLFEKNTDFVDAHFIPGGEYIVLLYWTGVIGLNKIEKSVATGELHLREIKRYCQDYGFVGK
ncbi:hypothetical protein BDM02DRAFT_3121980 [Thelephora ganbajun]|uniref:Uncharacterized protein n=1 Tax=Thelephora ganbajun TaxID=370292 RepID=A0ACB6Z3W1_THEGA|nr:hypothetical protein BDM02DRAFT_3121980 [Thelephora ganbajun]